MFNKLSDYKKEKLSKKIMPATLGAKIYLSKTMLGLCKNPKCQNQRREKSKYCGQCQTK